MKSKITILLIIISILTIGLSSQLRANKLSNHDYIYKYAEFLYRKAAIEDEKNDKQSNSNYDITNGVLTISKDWNVKGWEKPFEYIVTKPIICDTIKKDFKRFKRKKIKLYQYWFSGFQTTSEIVMNSSGFHPIVILAVDESDCIYVIRESYKTNDLDNLFYNFYYEDVFSEENAKECLDFYILSNSNIDLQYKVVSIVKEDNKYLIKINYDQDTVHTLYEVQKTNGNIRVQKIEDPLKPQLKK